MIDFPDGVRLVPRLGPAELEQCARPAVGEAFNPSEHMNAVDIAPEILRSERFTSLEKLVWGRVTLLCMFGPNTSRDGWKLNAGDLAIDLGTHYNSVIGALRRLHRLGALEVRPPR